MPTKLNTRWWSWKFQQRCTTTGKNLSVSGPCSIQSTGTIKIGDDLTVRSRKHNMVEISCATDALLTLGNNVFLNQGVRIACSNTITIGDNALIGDETVILDNDYHGAGDKLPHIAPVTIEPDVWLGTRVIVLRGVTIGRGSVVGAGAVVTRSIPPYTFAAGVPARVIKSLAVPA